MRHIAESDPHRQRRAFLSESDVATSRPPMLRRVRVALVKELRAVEQKRRAEERLELAMYHLTVAEGVVGLTRPAGTVAKSVPIALEPVAWVASNSLTDWRVERQWMRLLARD